MKYFIDTEFVEGTQKSLFNINKKPTIDLISIGIVAEDGREYYAICKEFNLKEAWNRYQLEVNRHYPIGPPYVKNYWLRENVCKNLICKNLIYGINGSDEVKTFKDFKTIVNHFGKTRKEIAREVKDFVSMAVPLSFNMDAFGMTNSSLSTFEGRMKCMERNFGGVEFYGYYADYDWVAFCWLFGHMIDLPEGFPYYCKDLQQMFDAGLERRAMEALKSEGNVNPLPILKSNIETWMKTHPKYPAQDNEHNALADARWNKRFYEFLKENL